MSTVSELPFLMLVHLYAYLLCFVVLIVLIFSCDNWDFYKTVEEGNTGFYYVRSNSKTIKLFNDVKLEAPK